MNNSEWVKVVSGKKVVNVVKLKFFFRSKRGDEW